MERQPISLRQSLILLLTAAIWGAAFVAQRVGMDYIGVFTFNGVRSIIGGFVLLPYIALTGCGTRRTAPSASRAQRRTLLLGGVLCGIFLCLASAFQQIGILYTSSVGKAGFITACYIILVPIFQLIGGAVRRALGQDGRQRANPLLWLAVVISVIGLYLLCVNEGFSIERADVLVFGCAVLFSFHILVIDYFSPKTDGVKMSCIQFFVCGALSLIPAFLFEHPTATSIIAAWQPVLYAGVLSSGVGYTLQIIGQKNMNPTVASLILSLESCFSVLAGWIILHQQLGAREIAGCILMFAAIVLAQISAKKTATCVNGN